MLIEALHLNSPKQDSRNRLGREGIPFNAGLLKYIICIN
jgi:hypothetical protein